jgi:hypothetical protein
LTTDWNYRTFGVAMSKVVTHVGLRLLGQHKTLAAKPTREDLSRIVRTALDDERPLIPTAKLFRRRKR